MSFQLPSREHNSPPGAQDATYREYYNAHAGSYDQLRFDSDKEVSRTADLIIENTSWQPTDVVLEVGSGTARHLDVLEDRRLGRYVAVDHNIEQLRHRKNNQGQSVCASALQLPFPNASAAAYLAIMVIHQISVSNLRQFFSEARRVLRPGSFLCIKTSSTGDLHRRPLVQYFPSTKAINDSRYHPIEAIAEVLRDDDFDPRIVPKETRDIFSVDDYLEKVRGRGNTMLGLVTDAEFEEGYKRLSASLRGRTTFDLIHHHTYIFAHVN